MKSLFLFITSIALIGCAPSQAKSSTDGNQLGPIATQFNSNGNQLIHAAMTDTAGFERLTEMCDTFGPRFSGSENLEKSIDWILEEMKADGLENVHGEDVMVPKWVRGREYAQMTAPWSKNLAILGLGGSVGTESRELKGEVLVVNSFDDLKARANDAKGKIILYNVPFTTYGKTVQYRYRGASEAAKVGAIASLVRSVGPYSMNTPHTGTSAYEEGVKKIPHAAITLEDAAMMGRMSALGLKIKVKLYMEGRSFGDVPSQNVMGEIKGSEYPDEVIVLGGHIDSWDVGQGAHDDGGGCVAAWHAVKLIKDLGLKPKRTIRAVMWTNEENGLRGGDAYRDNYFDVLDDHILAMESDAGVFKPSGFGFSGSDEAFKILQDIGTLLSRIDSGVIMDQSKMTMMTDESVMNHKG